MREGSFTLTENLNPAMISRITKLKIGESQVLGKENAVTTREDREQLGSFDRCVLK